MDENRALRERVAEALGWTDLRYFEGYRPLFSYNWTSGIEGIPPGGFSQDRIVVPDWPNDLNAAVRLPVEAYAYDWVIVCSFGNYGADASLRIKDHNYLVIGEFEGSAHNRDEPAEAVCLAWLEWKQEQRVTK